MLDPDPDVPSFICTLQSHTSTLLLAVFTLCTARIMSCLCTRSYLHSSIKRNSNMFFDSFLNLCAKDFVQNKFLQICKINVFIF